VSSPRAEHAEYGVPIRNLWHMLLYAWNEVPVTALRGWTLEAVEQAPTLDSLLASVLIQLMQQRLRIGLGHDYVAGQGTLRGIRGRIAFAETIKQRAIERGQLVCDFEAYSANSLKNQIIRTTLVRLLKQGHFGPDAASAKEMQQRLRRLVRDLDGIDFIDLTPDLIHRQLLAQYGNDHDYRLMLAICDLVLQRKMPGGSSGNAIVPLIDRELLVLYRVYERFVVSFFRVHLKDWEIHAQKRLEWHTPEPDDRLPLMVPDLLLQERATGQLIVLDTKFTVHSLVANQWGKPVYDSSHLYQMYAYLKSQEHLSEPHRHANGILLYPAVQARLSERIQLQDHVIRIESLDLAAAWREVERQLIHLVYRTPPPSPGNLPRIT
jgi:5-methylcytosine-specific restriction enzyme subunit McrC